MTAAIIQSTRLVEYHKAGSGHGLSSSECLGVLWQLLQLAYASYTLLVE